MGKEKNKDEKKVKEKPQFINNLVQTTKKGMNQISEGFKSTNRKVKCSIRYKILLSFVVPVFFIIAVGVASYSMAKSGITEKYENSTLETVKMAAEHIDLATNYVRSDAIRLAMDDEINALCRGTYDDDFIMFKTANDIAVTSLLSAQGANSFLKHLHLVTNSTSKVKMYSTKSNQVAGILESYLPEMKDPQNSNNIINWIGRHDSLDKALNFVDTDDYFISYQELATSKAYAVVIDVSTRAVQEFIDGIDLGEGSVFSIVSMNGRELIHETPIDGEEAKYSSGSIRFFEQDFYKEALERVTALEAANSDEASAGTMEVSFDGRKCLFFYAPCKVSGCMICGLVPTSTVVAQARSISIITIILVVVALIVVLSIGLLITSAIQINMKKISDGVDEVSKGNLTIDIQLKGHDEFKSLSEAVNEMVSNTKQLVTKVDESASGLEESSTQVKKASELLDACSSDISSAISDIKNGMERQSVHADECVSITDMLSEEIKNVSGQVDKVKVVLNEANGMINESVKIINSLGERAQETTVATDNVETAVRSLNEETVKINSFVGKIKKISSQTRLLSLNASIEAARAGEAGRGFGVVAEEIRKLSNDSETAAEEISKLVVEINAQAKSSSASTEQAHDIVDRQADLIKDAIRIFESMKNSIDTLIESIGNIDQATIAADTRRGETVNAVRDIAVIISENALNTQTVMEVADQLKANIDQLNNTARILGESMDEMKTEVSAFKI